MNEHIVTVKGDLLECHLGCGATWRDARDAYTDESACNYHWRGLRGWDRETLMSAAPILWQPIDDYVPSYI